MGSGEESGPGAPSAEHTHDGSKTPEGVPGATPEGQAPSSGPAEGGDVSARSHDEEAAEAASGEESAPAASARAVDESSGKSSDEAVDEPDDDSDDDSDEASAADDTDGEDAESHDDVEEIEERPVRSHVAPALISLEEVHEDSTFQLRPEGEISLLATEIARLGQLFPVDLRPRPEGGFQVVTGFRRVAALRFLQREKVLARMHTDLSDEDALLLALAAAIHTVPVSREELSELRDQLEADGRLTAATRDMLEKALAEGDSLSPENVEEEIDADELASDVTARLGDINQDLSLLADVFASLDDSRRSELLTQLKYSADLVAFLEGKE